VERGERAKRYLLGRQLLDGEDGEDHVLDAEPGVDRFEPRREKAGEMLGIAARPCGAETDMLDPAIDAVKGEVEPARAHPLACQPRDEVIGQPFGRAGKVGRVGDRLGKAETHPPDWRLVQWRQWFGQSPERLIEAACHLGAKPAGERGARHRNELADPLQPDPVQPGNRHRVEPQRFDRQWRQRRLLFVRPRQCRLVGARRKARQRPGGAKTAGDRDAVRDALTQEAPCKIGGKSRFAAP
jgi:hypothetical protein